VGERTRVDKSTAVNSIEREDPWPEAGCRLKEKRRAHAQVRQPQLCDGGNEAGRGLVVCAFHHPSVHGLGRHADNEAIKNGRVLAAGNVPEMCCTVAWGLSLRLFVLAPCKPPKTPLSRIGAEPRPILDEQSKNNERVCRKLERSKVHKSSNICGHHLKNEPFALF